MFLSRAFITTVYVITALVHLLPATGVLGARQLERLYQLRIDASQVELLLMRHRAVLFSLVGFLLMDAAWRPELRSLAGRLGACEHALLLCARPLLPGAQRCADQGGGDRSGLKRRVRHRAHARAARHARLRPSHTKVRRR